VSALRRTRVGPFVPEHSLPFDADTATAQARLLPAATAVRGLPRIVLSDAQLSRFARGQAVLLATQSGGETGADTTIAVFDAAGQFVGIGRTGSDARLVHPVKVFIG